MMTQLNIKDRLKAFSSNGDKAILKEIKQLHTQQVHMPHSRNDMSHKERQKVLRYQMFLKENRDGTIKARHRKPMLHVQLKKALYGTLQAA